MSNIESNNDSNECISNNSEEEDNTLLDVDDDIQSKSDLNNTDTDTAEQNIFKSNKRSLYTDKMSIKNKRTKQNDDLISFLKKSSDERKEMTKKKTQLMHFSNPWH